jgi:diadenosine tetraphosphate (Ap4A) HIT family hydrolase
LILVPKVTNISEIIDLSASQQAQLWQESAMVSHVLTQLFIPDKLNVAALGNMVSQLHVHHVVRYQDDISWPKPIWGQVPAKPYTSEAADEQINLIKTAIETRNKK